MIGYILWALGIVAYVGGIFWVIGVLFDGGFDGVIGKIAALVGFAMLVFTIWFTVQVTNNSAPCAQYETQLMFNPATKTMMPAQFCVKEGTWVKP